MNMANIGKYADKKRHTLFGLAITLIGVGISPMNFIGGVIITLAGVVVLVNYGA